MTIKIKLTKSLTTFDVLVGVPHVGATHEVLALDVDEVLSESDVMNVRKLDRLVN